MDKLFTVYKTTNKVNGKYYIGVHKTFNPLDDYYGSGKYLNYAIEKYGIENFSKEILAIFETKKEAYQLESKLVTWELIESGQVYNLKPGGYGGFEWINKEGRNYGNHIPGNAKKASMKGVLARQYLIDTDENFREANRNAGKKGAAAAHKKRKDAGLPGTFFGKKHTEETKNKISQANSIHQQGEGNSQYGTCWIMNLDLKQNKKIKKEELDIWLKQGWVKGRKCHKEF